MRLLPLLSAFSLTAALACATSSGTSSRLTRVEQDASAPREAGELRVMTFNIQSGLRGLDGVAEVIRSAHPDIVALQEVDRGSRRAGGLDQTAVLAQQTGLPYHAHFRTTDLYGGAYGIALLSRFPLEALAQYPLPVPRGAEPRTVAHALMQVAGREVSVYVTHLIRRPFNGDARMRQSALIAGLLDRDPRPKLLMGDLNDDPDSRTVRLLRRDLTDVVAASGQGSRGTYPLPLPFSPTLRIDYVLACDAFVPLRSEVLHVGASDHYPVVADVRLKEAPMPEVVSEAAP
ncbi:endonuclease/exonuclease/phosphatase family protein [Hyalangium sp.]|uniref:endonuclease/exonuclease/phosphatase family protein n=1 Tax=Hyalangium sp. TaxID=2028555 RepID=UPI002D2B00A1|nr:endonuclease/exonuclease/phosphatase family protein [Hyalangium sp.]HYH99513.1 endonuclease/exonuclease/phosphatase family protein [Hyalangium sp.]